MHMKTRVLQQLFVIALHNKELKMSRTARHQIYYPNAYSEAPRVTPQPLHQGWRCHQELFFRLTTGLTNHHKSFQHTLSSLTCSLVNFPGGHSSQDYSNSNTLKFGVFLVIDSQKDAPW